VLLQIHPLAELALGEFTLLAFGVKFPEPCGIRMESDERVQQVEGDIDGLPVGKELGLADELIEPLPVNELRDQVPFSCPGFAGPERLHHMRMMDLSQRPELPANCIVTRCVVEQFKSSLLTLHVVTDAVDLGGSAVIDYLQDFEAVVDDSADSVVGD